MEGGVPIEVELLLAALRADASAEGWLARRDRLGCSWRDLPVVLRAKLILARARPAGWLRLVRIVPMYAVDMLAAGWSALLTAIAAEYRWHATERA